MKLKPEIFHQLLDNTDFVPNLLEGISSSFQSSISSQYGEKFRYHCYNGILSLLQYFKTKSLDHQFMDLLNDISFLDSISEEEEENEDLFSLHDSLFSFIQNLIEAD